MIRSEKEKFLEKVSSLFFIHGAKSFTMDDIAKEFSMSKKTLYTQYKTKEDLLIEVLDFILVSIIHKIEISDQKFENPIEKMLMREIKIDEISKCNNNLFLRQLVKYYPTIFNNHLIKIHKKASVIIIDNIKSGRKQGLYRADFDADLYCKFLLHLKISPDTSPLFEKETSKENMENFCQETMYFFLHSIVTEKGSKILTQLKKQYEELV